MQLPFTQQRDAGNYHLEILNASGQTLQTRSINISADKKIMNLNLNNMAAGLYQLHLYNSQTSLYKSIAVD